MPNRNRQPNQQPPSQMPPGGQQPGPGQQPDHRIKEMQDQMRKLNDDNQQLRGQVNYMAKNSGQRQPEAPAKTESVFEDKVEAALEAKIKGAIDGSLNPMQQQMQQQIGRLVDQNDELSYKLKYGANEKYAKYDDKVESIRGDFQSRNQYIPREEALRMAYFEDHSKAPTQDPMDGKQDVTTPTYSAYFGTMVGKDGMPIQDTGEPTPQPQNFEQNPPQQNYEQPPNYNQQNVQQPPMDSHQQQAVNDQNRVLQNAGFEVPQLPDQGVNNSYAAQNQQQSPMSLDVESSADQLKAFEDRMGDVPF